MVRVLKIKEEGMLVLSRKPGESLVIGKNIRITITQIGRQRVRLGVDAPKDVHVRRSELLELDGIISEGDSFDCN